jgi:hypothetical protein
MIRLRIAAVAAATSLACAAAAAPVATASNGTGSQFRAYHFPALYTVAVKGATQNGNKQFTGTFGIQRFVSRNGQAWAVGTLRGTVAGHHITRYGVMMPASLNQTPPASPSRAGHAAQTCQVLNLVLGPIHLNLLGLVIDTNQITLNITAVSGPGNLLGNLLCGISNLLNQGSPSLLSQIEGQLQQLTGLLNSLLGSLGGI